MQRAVEGLVTDTERAVRAEGGGYAEAEAELLRRFGWGALAERPPEPWYAKGRPGSGRRQSLGCGTFSAAALSSAGTAGGRRHENDTAIVDPPPRGVQPVYVDNGPVAIVTSEHLGITQIDMDKLDHTSSEFYKSANVARANLSTNDVLLYATGAYVGRTNCWLGEGEALASNHVTIIRPDRKVCHPVYLALFLNSPAGLSQSERAASGSTQRELYPSEVTKIVVFLPKKNGDKIDLDWQKMLAGKVLAANEAIRRARGKLADARTLVENEIQRRIDA